jgi:hypothetical protein
VSDLGWDGKPVVMCPKTNASIQGGAACRYLAGHEEAGMPHTLDNGLWWHDEESQAAAERIRGSSLTDRSK